MCSGSWGGASQPARWLGLVLQAVHFSLILSYAVAQPLLLPLTWETTDYEFITTLGVGTPAQPFRLLVDTGSANLWVPSSQCSSLSCTQRAQYTPAQSSTAKPLDKAVSISYGAGEAELSLVQDVVSLPAQGSGSSSSGGGFIPGKSVTQVIGAAIRLDTLNSSSNTQQPWDGILGMGRQKLAAGGVTPLVLSLYQQQVVSKPQFGLWLVMDSSRPGAGGEMALGGYNQQRVAGEVTWVDVVMPALPVQQGFWSVPVGAVSLAYKNGTTSTPAGACTGFAGGLGSSGSSGSSSGSGSSSSSGGQPGCVGLLDSGTSQVIGSIDQVAALNQALGGVPSIKQLPFNCGKLVAAVLANTAQALSSSSDPNAAANEVCSSMFGANAADSLESILCGAVQQELFNTQQQAASPAQALGAAQQRSLAFCSQLPYALNVSLDCKAIDSMPNITFTIRGKVINMPVGSYAYQNPSNRLCYSQISAIGSLGAGAWILGSSVMQSVYTVFDYGAHILAAASAAGNEPQQAAAAGSPPQQAAASVPLRGLVQQAQAQQAAAGAAGPRVGLGDLTAAEQAAAQAAFNQGLAQKSSSAITGLGGMQGGSWRPLLLLISVSLLLRGW